jgi:hypothetical protein
MSEKYLIVKGCAGLGNRLYTVFSAIDYCERTGRKLYVDWSDGLYGRKSDNVFCKYFDLSVNSADFDEILKRNQSGAKVYPFPFDQKLRLGLYDLYQPVSSPFSHKIPYNRMPLLKFNMLKEHWALNENVKVKKKNSIVSYLKLLSKGSAFPMGQNLHYSIKEEIAVFADYAPVFIEKNIKYLSVKPVISQIVDVFSAENNFDQAIGVHVRSTDMKPSVEINVLIELIKREHPGKKVFLSTDNTDVLAIFKLNFKDLIVFNKFIPELKGNESLHAWASVHSAPEKAEQIFKESIIDMYLLSKCDMLYYQGNSTFSIISKALHPDKRKCINWLN